MPGNDSVSATPSSPDSPFIPICNTLPPETELFKLKVQQDDLLGQELRNTSHLTPEVVTAILVDNHVDRQGGKTIPDLMRRELLILILSCPNVYDLMVLIFSQRSSTSDDVYTTSLRAILKFYITDDTAPSPDNLIAEWTARELTEDLQRHLIKDINSKNSNNLMEIFNKLSALGSITAYEQPIVILLRLFKAEILTLMRSNPSLLVEMLNSYQNPTQSTIDSSLLAVQIFLKLTELLRIDTSLSQEMQGARTILYKDLNDFIDSIARKMRDCEYPSNPQACGFSLRYGV